MRAALSAIAIAVALTTAGFAVSQAPPLPGYLAGHEPDTVASLPPAPRPGDARDLADMQVFHATRALAGTPRWGQAARDADLSAPALLADFDCAAEVHLTPENSPALMALLARSRADVAAAYSQPKDLYQRPRPYMREAADICLPRSKALDESFDYPSGHSSLSWFTGMILAQLAPDRAGPILQRARSIGESRVVCGVHTLSAVTEGRTAAASVAAALESDPRFRADVEAARLELAQLRAKAGPRSAAASSACDAETALIARSPW